MKSVKEQRGRKNEREEEERGKHEGVREGGREIQMGGKGVGDRLGRMERVEAPGRKWKDRRINRHGRERARCMKRERKTKRKEGGLNRGSRQDRGDFRSLPVREGNI